MRDLHLLLLLCSLELLHFGAAGQVVPRESLAVAPARTRLVLRLFARHPHGHTCMRSCTILISSYSNPDHRTTQPSCCLR